MRWSSFQDYATFQQKALYRSDNTMDLRKLFSHFFSLPPPASNSYHGLSSPQKIYFCIIPSYYHEEAPLLATTTLLHGQSSQYMSHTTYCQIYTLVCLPTKTPNLPQKPRECSTGSQPTQLSHSGFNNPHPHPSKRHTVICKSR